MLVLLSYIWCDEHWMAAYNIPDYSAEARNITRIVQFHFTSFILGVLLIVAAIVYRHFYPGDPHGFPWYFIYLVPAVPRSSLRQVFSTPRNGLLIGAHSVSHFFFSCLLACFGKLLLALPYGWWGFRPAALIGLTVGAWSNLPIEEPCVWMAVTFTTIITYEVIKIWKALGAGALQAFFGIGK